MLHLTTKPYLNRDSLSIIERWTYKSVCFVKLACRINIRTGEDVPRMRHTGTGFRLCFCAEEDLCHYPSRCSTVGERKSAATWTPAHLPVTLQRRIKLV